MHFDVLRVIAALAVVWVHTSAQEFYFCYPSVEWDVRDFYDCLARWCVPIFVMISGALFLDSLKGIDIKTLYSKNITRVASVFIFWSIVYGVYDGMGEKGFVGLAEEIVQGPLHFWFIKMLIGLYIMVPILRAIVVDKRLEQYFICLLLVTAFFIPMLFVFTDNIPFIKYIPFIDYISDVARDYAEKYCYVGYFVFGHYLANINIKKPVKRMACILGILSVFAVGILTYLYSYRVGKPYVFFYKSSNLFTLLEAVALFVVIKDIKIAPQYHPVILSASKLTIGIYIIHPLVMSVLSDYGNINSSSLNPVYFIPVFALMVFVISYCVSFVLVKIPIIKKFLI